MIVYKATTFTYVTESRLQGESKTPSKALLNALGSKFWTEAHDTSSAMRNLCSTRLVSDMDQTQAIILPMQAALGHIRYLMDLPDSYYLLSGDDIGIASESSAHYLAYCISDTCAWGPKKKIVAIGTITGYERRKVGRHDHDFPLDYFVFTQSETI